MNLRRLILATLLLLIPMTAHGQAYNVPFSPPAAGGGTSPTFVCSNHEIVGTSATVIAAADPCSGTWSNGDYLLVFVTVDNVHDTDPVTYGSDLTEITSVTCGDTNDFVTLAAAFLVLDGTEDWGSTNMQIGWTGGEPASLFAMVVTGVGSLETIDIKDHSTVTAAPFSNDVNLTGTAFVAYALAIDNGTSNKNTGLHTPAGLTCPDEDGAGSEDCELGSGGGGSHVTAVLNYEEDDSGSTGVKTWNQGGSENLLASTEGSCVAVQALYP